MSGYEYQAVNHDASINAERVKDRVVIEIVRGEKKPVRITMWAEDFARMAKDVS